MHAVLWWLSRVIMTASWTDDQHDAVVAVGGLELAFGPPPAITCACSPPICLCTASNLGLAWQVT